MKDVRRLLLQFAIGIVALLLLAFAVKAFAADLRLDIVQVDDVGNPVSTASQSVLTFNYTTPIVTAYVRQDRVFGNGFDS